MALCVQGLVGNSPEAQKRAVIEQMDRSLAAFRAEIEKAMAPPAPKRMPPYTPAEARADIAQVEEAARDFDSGFVLRGLLEMANALEFIAPTLSPMLDAPNNHIEDVARSLRDMAHDACGHCRRQHDECQE